MRKLSPICDLYSCLFCFILVLMRACSTTIFITKTFIFIIYCYYYCYLFFNLYYFSLLLLLLLSFLSLLLLLLLLLLLMLVLVILILVFPFLGGKVFPNRFQIFIRLSLSPTEFTPCPLVKKGMDWKNIWLWGLDFKCWRGFLLSREAEL